MASSSNTTVKLDHSVTVDGRPISEITLRRPKGRDIIKMSKVNGSDTDRLFAHLSDLAEEPVEVLAELDAADIERLAEALEGFKARQQ